MPSLITHYNPSSTLLFHENHELAGVFRTFSHMNPKLFIEAPEVKKVSSETKTGLEQALAQIKSQFGAREVDERITEVSSLLPDIITIELGKIDTSRTYPEREVSVNGFRFRIWQERTNNGNFGGQVPVCKIQPIFGENNTFSLPNELEVIDDTKNMLNNRASKINSWISNKEGIFIGNVDDIGKWLHEMFLEYKKLALGHTFESLAKDTPLRRNYGFLVWLILHYNTSSQK